MKLGSITNDVITFAYTDSAKKRNHARNAMARYACTEDGVPIFRRTYMIGDAPQPGLINQHLNVDHFSEIVDDSVGYFIGQPVKVGINKDRYAREKSILTKIKDKVFPEAEKEAIDDANYALQRYGVINDIDLLNSETAKYCAIAGYSGRLNFVDINKELRVKNIAPDQCAFYDDCAFYFFSEWSIDGATSKKVEKCWAFDGVYRYVATITGSSAEIDTDAKAKTGKAIIPHGYQGIPLIECRNNADEHGDAFKVLSLIDEYDRIVSDWGNETEQHRLAFLVLEGISQPTPPKEGEPAPESAFDLIKKHGGCYMPIGGKIYYVTKEIPWEPVAAYLKELRDNIFTVSATPNPHDENFSGNSSGVALEYKYRPRDNKTITKERFFQEFLHENYRLYCSAAKEYGKASIDYSTIDFNFTRNFPKNILEEAQIQTYLDGKVPVVDRLKLCSFIPDAEEAATRLAAEKEDELKYNTPPETGEDLLIKDKAKKDANKKEPVADDAE